jgi:signal peptidase I
VFFLNKLIYSRNYNPKEGLIQTFLFDIIDLVARDVKIQTSADLNRDDEGENLIWEVAKTIGGILLFLIIFRFFIFQPFTIKGSSMEPNFHDGEYLIVNEFSYHFSKPKRGDVVIFKHPEPACTSFVESNYINRIFFQGPCQNYIKRIIGLPGDTVVVKDGKVTVKSPENPEGKVLDEEYILENIPTLGNQTVTVGENEYYVIGDNRNPNASSDSREWGVLPRSHIVGKGFLILLPVDKIGTIKTPKY